MKTITITAEILPSLTSAAHHAAIHYADPAYIRGGRPVEPFHPDLTVAARVETLCKLTDSLRHCRGAIMRPVRFTMAGPIRVCHGVDYRLTLVELLLLRDAVEHRQIVLRAPLDMWEAVSTAEAARLDLAMAALNAAKDE